MDLTDISIKVPVDWYYLMGMFIFAAAIATFGIDAFARGWIKEGLIKNKKIIVFADIFAVTQCLVVGGIVGIVVWNPIITSAISLLGALGYKFFMKILRAYLRKKGISLSNGGTVICKDPPPCEEEDDDENKDNTLDLYSRAE